MKRLLLSLILSATMLCGYSQVTPTLTQCAEITSSGAQCTRAAEPGTKLCKRHGKPRCGEGLKDKAGVIIKPGGITQKGQPCRIPVNAPGDRCYLHKFQ